RDAFEHERVATKRIHPYPSTHDLWPLEPDEPAHRQARGIRIEAMNRELTLETVRPSDHRQHDRGYGLRGSGGIATAQTLPFRDLDLDALAEPPFQNAQNGANGLHGSALPADDFTDVALGHVNPEDRFSGILRL